MNTTVSRSAAQPGSACANHATPKAIAIAAVNAAPEALT